MASQPTSGDQYSIIGTVGTVVLANHTTTLKRILIPGTFVGSVAFYDSPTAAGTTATNNIYNVVLPGVNTNRSIEVHARMREGLTYAATGTPTITVTWD